MKPPVPHPLRCLAVLALGGFGLLAGCAEQDLYVQLTEQQANEMVAALRAAQVKADKVAREAGAFAVTVPADAFAQSIEILRAQGLPRGGFDSLGQVFKKEGFMSSPLEERARLTHALSQEIANTLSNIDGVLLARVHVSMPEKDRLADRPTVASASVFVKHRAGVDLSGQTGPIKALVVNSIEGLAYENVTVALFAAEEGAVGGVVTATRPASIWSSTLGGTGLAVGAALLLTGLLPGWWRRAIGAFQGARDEH
jgi:type III secretion protein J